MASVISISNIPLGRRRSAGLANGDRLTRAEFERRYAAMPDGKKAELIEGMVYTAPPARYDVHGNPHAILITWLGYYLSKTPGLHGFGDNCTVRLDNDNETQPDVFLMLPPLQGGRAIVDPDGYITGPPALVCEISASSVSIDLHSKKTAYRRNGVQEYLVWRTEDAAVDWFALVDGDYVLIAPESDGTIRSRAFPGLWLHPPTLLTAQIDLSALFALLDKAVGSSEHLDFVNRLKNVPPVSLR